MNRQEQFCNALNQYLVSEFEQEARTDISALLIRERGKQWLSKQPILIPKAEQERILTRIEHAFVGLGPLEPFLQDRSVSEIMVNGYKSVFIERNGNLESVPSSFQDDDHLIRVINRIVGTVGRRIDQKNPLVDARLLDGSRVNAVIAPLSLCGPVLTIRKFPESVFTFDDLVGFGSLSKDMQLFLETAIRDKKNILISGGTGAGKTSTLNACASCIAGDERVITIEDVAEINIDHPHHIPLETRAANIEGGGAIPIRSLLKNALRMRPDRIIVGEIRGEEVIDMLQAMNTGHKGSLTTVHANAPLESLYRLETMVLMGGDVPLQSVRPQIVQAIDVVVQQRRLSDGRRVITHISEVQKDQTDTLLVQDRFIWEGENHICCASC